MRTQREPREATTGGAPGPDAIRLPDRKPECSAGRSWCPGSVTNAMSAPPGQQAQPQHFDPVSHSLSGCYHPPQVVPRQHAIVLCHPFGHEAGLCAGADHAFGAATLDQRVAGACLIDFLYVPTWRYYLQRNRDLAFDYRRWRRMLTGESGLRAKLGAALAGLFARRSQKQNGRMGQEQREARARRGLAALIDRGVDLSLVFTADGPSWYHYRRCFRTVVEGADTPVRVDVIRDTDHVFTGLSAQDELIDIIGRWADGVVTRGAGAQPSHAGP